MKNLNYNLKVNVNVKEMVEKLNVTDLKVKNGARSRSYVTLNFVPGNSYIERMFEKYSTPDNYCYIKVSLDRVEIVEIPESTISILDEKDQLIKYFNLLDSFGVETATLTLDDQFNIVIEGNDISKKFDICQPSLTCKTKDSQILSTFTMDTTGIKKTRLAKDFATLQKVKADNDKAYTLINDVYGKMISSDTLELACIDGYRLAMKHYNITSNLDDSNITDFLINDCTLTSIIKIIKNSYSVSEIKFNVNEYEGKRELEICLTVKTARNSAPSIISITLPQPTEIKFFDYSQITLNDDDKKYQFKINQKDLLNTLKNFKCYYSELDNNLIINDVTEKSYFIEVDGIRKNLGTEIIDTTGGNGFGMSFGINGNYLYQAVDDLEGEITINSTGIATSPITLNDQSGNNEHLILPIRLQS